MNVKDLKIKAGDIELHVVDYVGSGSDTILLVHGLTANARYWDAVAERLVDQYRVIAVDLRGRGDSEKPVTGYYDLWQYAWDIKEFLETMQLDQVILMGHSMGAMTGVVFASQFPEKLYRLILVDGGVELEQEDLVEVGKALSFRLDTLGKVFPSWQSFLNLMKKSSNHQDWNDYIERYFWHDLRHNDDGSVISKTPRHVVFPFEQRPASLDEIGKKIQVPTLLLQASLGLKYSEGQAIVVQPQKGKNFVSQLPEGSRFVQIEEANHHSIILNHYEKLVDEVKRFLQNSISGN